MKKLFISLSAIFFSLSIIISSFPQTTGETSANKEEQKSTNAAEMQAAFEKAMRQIAADKEKEEQKTLAMLKEKLSAASHEWILSAKKGWEGNLNKYVDQNWETLVKFGDPAHYEYYLRDFIDIQGGSDIIKTDSLVVPYKGSTNVTEKLYVERYHTPDASDITMFFYTFTNPMKVNFEYRDNRFVFTTVESGEAQLDNDWPKEIRELWFKYGERFRTMTPKEMMHE